MKILLSSGDKTTNIAVPLRSRFSSGAVTVDAERDIDSILAYLQRGETFDRAIIVEPAIMGDFGSQNWEYGRKKIVELVNRLGPERDTAQFIFVVTTKELADIIREETFELGEYRVKIILALAKFKLKFFIGLCTNELSEISDTYESISTAQTVDNAVEVDVPEPPAEEPQQEMPEYAPEETVEESVGEDEAWQDEPEEEDGFTSFDESLLEDNGPDPGTEKYENPENTHDVSTLTHIEAVEISEEPEEVTEGIPELDSTASEMFSEPESSRDESELEELEKLEAVDIPEETPTEEDSTDKANNFGGETDWGAEDSFTPDSLGDVEENPGTDTFSGDFYNETPSEPVPEEVPEEVPETPAQNMNEQYFNDMYKEDQQGDSILEHMQDNDMKALRKLLQAWAQRKTSIVITGSPCSGKTTVAYNIAVLIAKLGYTTLYVDCDTETRGVSYIDERVYKWVHTDDNTIASLSHAIGNSANAMNYTGVIFPGLHVLTMGLDQDIAPLDKIGNINKEKIHKFSSMMKQSYNFIIYDVPFNQFEKSCIDLVYSGDKVVYMTDCTTRGLVELMLDVANVDDDDLRLLFMRKMSIVLNKYYKGTKLFGRKINNSSKLLQQLDTIIYEVVGDNVSERFENMRILRTIPLNPEMENSWYTKKAFTETNNGLKVIGGLLKNILEA